MTSLSQPVRVHNLTAWFIFAPPAAVHSIRDYAVLEETIDAATAVLHETGNVHELLIENTGDVDLFIQAGDIVKGGRQDRTIGADFIVPAKSGRIPLPAYCVEQSRWHRRRDESDTHFSKAKDFLASKKARLAMRFSKSQSEVWESVAEEQEQLVKAVQQEVRDAASPTSLQLTYESESVTAAIEGYAAVLEAALPKAGGNVVGVVWAINGVPSHADQYASPQLFAKLWRKLLRAAATDAIAQRPRCDLATAATTESPAIQTIREWHWQSAEWTWRVQTASLHLQAETVSPNGSGRLVICRMGGTRHVADEPCHEHQQAGSCRTERTDNGLSRFRRRTHPVRLCSVRTGCMVRLLSPSRWRWA